MNDLIEAVELERVADWRIKKLGEDPADRQSAAAAELLAKLAQELRVLRGSPAYTEYLAILNWLGEFDVMEVFADRAHDYRMHIGINHFPETGDAYLGALTGIARDIAGA